MIDKKLIAIVLAAGHGTRMHAIDKSYNKVCYPILGKPIVRYVVDAIKVLNPANIIAVVGSGKDVSTSILKDDCKVVEQVEINGTLGALKCCVDELSNFDGDVIVAYGDIPLIEKQTLLEMYEKHCKTHSNLTILTSILLNPYGYNKIIRDNKTQAVLKINEEKEIDFDNYSTVEVDGGIYIFSCKDLIKHIDEVKKDITGELSIISLAEIFHNFKLKIETFVTSDNHEIYSINDRYHMAKASKILKKRINAKLMLSGVSIEDPKTTYISPDVEILPDTIIFPGTTIVGNCKIGHSNRLGPNTFLENVVIGNHNVITFSHISNCKIKNNTNIGPYSRLRDECVIEDNVKISNFVEIKKSHINKDVKCCHLSYVGDAEIGESTNIGCGTITANYDGFSKHKTTIGKNCFVGSGTILIAPIKLNDNCFTAAGSTITKDVNFDELAIERVEQTNIKGGYSRILNKAKNKTNKKN